MIWRRMVLDNGQVLQKLTITRNHSMRRIDGAA